MTGFAALIAASRFADGFDYPVPDSWRQGRTVYGGFTTAFAYHAAHAVATDLPALRCAQIAFVKPVGATLRTQATVLGRGKSSAFIEARVYSGDHLALMGTFLFMADRASAISVVAPAMPKVLPPEQSEPAMRGKGPAYRSHLEYRHAGDISERGKPRLLRWARLRERDGLDGAAELLLIGDALPGAVLPLFETPPLVSSATWTVHFHAADGTAQEGWWLLQSTAESASAGISCQQMTVWNRAGNAVISGSQTVSFYTANG